MPNRRLEVPLFQQWWEQNLQDDVVYQSMDWLQKLLYRCLLQRAYVCETQPHVPDDDLALMVLSGAKDMEMWQSNKEIILRKFQSIEQDGVKLLRQKRLEADWLEVQNRRDCLSQKRSQSGRIGGKKSAEVRRQRQGGAKQDRSNGEAEQSKANP
jgi:hypothetical protein